MKLSEAKNEFIQSWGALGSKWGISKTMAQIHALLLVSEEDLSADDIMERLNISRGNANLNVRALIDWGLVERVNRLGERKEFFKAEKDIWRVATIIANERRRRELEPILRVLSGLSDIDPKSGNAKEIASFQAKMREIDDFAIRVDKAFTTLAKADQNWFTNTLLKLLT